MVLNSAFVFIKPHAVNESVKKMVNAGLGEHGLKIVAEGTLTAEQIDKGMLIDNHYYAIASKATILKPNQLNVPAAKFQAQFNLGWQEALDKGVVYNAMDACKYLGLDAAGLDREWAKAKKEKRLIKFGGGFYCGFINSVQGKDPIYVFNGFFMQIRSKYVKPGVSIHYYVVEWESEKLSWEAFRKDALGPTDPADASPKSLRGAIYANWKALGLSAQPDVGDNGMHASASPFEAMAERANWLGGDIATDAFGRAAIQVGISKKTLQEWSVDPQVTYGAPSMRIKRSLFDSVEDVDTDLCLARLMMINSTLGQAKPAPASSTKPVSAQNEEKPCCSPAPVIKGAPVKDGYGAIHVCSAFVGGLALGVLLVSKFGKN
jgi:nucleoside diphosphate kinase